MGESIRVDVQAKTLASLLDRIAFVIPSNAINPLYFNVFLQASPAGLSITATDGEIIVSVIDNSEQRQPASGLLDFERIRSFVSSASDPIIIEFEKNKTRLRSGASKLNLQNPISEDFPTATSILGKSVRLDTERILTAIKTVAHARDSLGNTGIRAGTCFRIKNNNMSIIAADGRRIASYKFTTSRDDFGFILPFKIVNALRDSILLHEDEFKLTYSETAVVFDFGSTIICSRLMEGSYPDIEKIIERPSKKKILISGKQLSSALAVAAACSDPLDKVCFLDIAAGSVMISSKSQESEFEQHIDIKYEGDPVRIVVDHRFALEACKNFQGEIILGFGDPLDPLVFYSVDKPEARCIVAPVAR